jgi:flagellar hook-associated protein 2
MASITSSGAVSGLDVASLVAQLVAAERAPADTRLTKAQSLAQTRISALGSLKSALASLQTAAQALKGGGAIAIPAVSSSQDTLFTATATAAAARGSFSVEVVALAQSSKLVSGAYTNADTSLGNGTVDITMGSKTFTVTLADGANSLGALRTAINNASDNPGVTATLVTESGGTHLLLTGNQTGAANGVSLSSSLLALTQTQAAGDAHVRVEGYDVYSASNQVSGAIGGVTLNLLKAEVGTTGTLTLSADNSAASKAIQEFVTRYNATVTTINALTRYDVDKKQAATLTGDGAAREAMASLRSVIGGTVAGAGSYAYLSQLGIKTGSDGTLSVDSAKLAEALAKDSAGVAKLFGGDNGFATRLDATIEGLIADNGRIDAQTDGLNARLKDIGHQRDALELRMTQVQARLLKQFTALDSLLTRMRTTSDFLTQQLSALSGSNDN